MLSIWRCVQPDVSQGDEVITTPLSWIATAKCDYAGRRTCPVYVDIGTDLNIDPTLIEGEDNA